MKDYILTIAAAAMAVSVAVSLLRTGPIRKLALLAGGLLLTLAILGPLTRAKLEDFGQYLAGLELQTDAAVSGIAAESKSVMAAIIAEKTETYIWDKAAALGAVVTVSVEVRQGTDYPYPWAAEISGPLTGSQQLALSEWMERELAIPRERQVFVP